MRWMIESNTAGILCNVRQARQVWRALNSDEDVGARGREQQKQASTFNVDQHQQQSRLPPAPQYTSTADSDAARDGNNY
jgi:hypothetical protein